LVFFDAYSSEEARQALKTSPDIDVILLNIDFEDPQIGLDFVRYIREEANNALIQIIVYTMQNRKLPEKAVLTQFDITILKYGKDSIKDLVHAVLLVALCQLSAQQDISNFKKRQDIFVNSVMRFVPTNFLKLLNKHNFNEMGIGDNIEKHLSILFLDIRGFTTLSEFLLPIEIFQFINEVMAYLEPVIIQNKGFIDKYIGDAIMALFPGEPDTVVRAGIQLLQAIEDYNHIRLEQHQMPIKIGIGINTGSVVIGTVGNNDRMDCTVIGDSVNIAARVEKLTKLTRCHLLISENTYNALVDPAQFNCRYLGRMPLPGKKLLLGIYENFDVDMNEVIDKKKMTKKEFNAAIKLLSQGAQAEALEKFEKIQTINPRDRACAYFIEKLKNE